MSRLRCLWAISIHALREEGDMNKSMFTKSFTISIHALREEGDKLFPVLPEQPIGFLSTPSARRATILRFLALAA